MGIEAREKRGFSKTISGRFASLFRSQWRKVPGFGPDLSRPRIYTNLRWVYLRTKCFLFGPRASCASHGGFVAVAAAWGKIVRQANKSKDAPRVGGEPLVLLLLWPFSTSSLLHSARPSRVCVRIYAIDRPRNERE